MKNIMFLTTKNLMGDTKGRVFLFIKFYIDIIELSVAKHYFRIKLFKLFRLRILNNKTYKQSVFVKSEKGYVFDRYEDYDGINIGKLNVLIGKYAWLR